MGVVTDPSGLGTVALPLSMSPGTIAYLGRWMMPFFFAADIIGLKRPDYSAIVAVEGSNPAMGRNRAVRRMLDMPDHRWLLFVDDDMRFQEEDLRRLLLHDVPIVSALCSSRRRPHGPVASPITLEQIKSGELVEVERTGCAFLLIKREVFEALGDPYFRIGQLDPELLQEDEDFCIRARAKGFPILIDTSLQVGHQVDAWIYVDAPDGKIPLVIL